MKKKMKKTEAVRWTLPLPLLFLFVRKRGKAITYEAAQGIST